MNFHSFFPPEKYKKKRNRVLVESQKWSQHSIFTYYFLSSAHIRQSGWPPARDAVRAKGHAVIHQRLGLAVQHALLWCALLDLQSIISHLLAAKIATNFTTENAASFAIEYRRHCIVFPRTFRGGVLSIPSYSLSNLLSSHLPVVQPSLAWQWPACTLCAATAATTP